MKMKILVAIVVMSASARADVTVGVFAPSEPFPSTAARVELAGKLGEQVGKALNEKGTGKVFARAGDFAAAVKKGEITVALVDSAYLAAAGGNYTVIAAATRGGQATHAWQIVGRGVEKIADLKGKHVLVPSIGGREADFVTNVLLGGEVTRDFFGKIEAAPDTVSALAALGLGKADAAIVPADVEIPSGTRVVLALPQLPGPMLVAYGNVDKTALAAAIGFSGDATVGGLHAGDADAVRSVAHRFSAPVKRGPLVVPAVRLLVGDLVEGRTFAIERTPAITFLKMR